MDRRTFLKSAGALALVGGCGPGLAALDDVPVPPIPDGLPDDDDADLFPCGVQAGGCAASSILLWSFSARPGVHRLWRWRVEDGVAVDVVKDEIESDADGTLHVEVTDAAPGSTWFYAFAGKDDARRSAAGRVVVAPAPGASPRLVLAGATCTNWRTQPWVTLQRLATMDFDLLLHLGDMIYGDGARDEDAYRATWRRALADPGYRALLPRAAKLHVWDDHEFWNNPDPSSDPDRVEAAKRAFFACNAAHHDEGRLWRSHRWGDTAEIILLDARTERSGDEYLSRAQMDFLKDRLQNSDARFKVVMNSVPMTRLPDAYPNPEDRWQGYRTQRDEVLEVLEDDGAARGTLFVSGDFHLGFVGHAERDGVHRRILEVAVGPSGNRDNPFGVSPLRDVGLPPDQFDFVSGRLAATTITLDPDAGTIDAKFVDGETADVLFDDDVTSDD